MFKIVSITKKCLDNRMLKLSLIKGCGDLELDILCSFFSITSKGGSCLTRVNIFILFQSGLVFEVKKR
jgi:hypothetical protein